MKSFLDYLKEHGWQIEEDAVLAAGSAMANGDVASPNAPKAPDLDVSAPAACHPMTDNSVLGKPSSKDCKNGGFFGKNDFHIPQNVLSGEVEKREDLKCK